MIENANRQQQLYWNQMIELKVASEYVRRYRDRMGRWVTCVGAIKAIASSGSIAAWAVWHDYAFLWGLIIAIAQVIDALRDIFPFAKIQKSASEYATTLTTIFIDSQLEWENIFAGTYSDEQIANRRHKLMKLQHDAEHRSFPNGLTTRSAIFIEAQAEASTYFENMYRVK